MDPRRAEALKAEAMKAIPGRLDRLEEKIDRLLAIHESKDDGIAAQMTKAAPIGKPATFAQPPKGR
jgi:hypothetical protein